ncbi:MAG: hypothetical protein ACKVP5_17360 [Aestuariivirga sp.]
MRKVLVAAVILGGLSAPSLAYENFIPLGHGYAPDEPVLPSLSTERAQISQQSDIFETEVYRAEREDKVIDSFLNRFISDQEKVGGDYSIDY